MKLFKNILPILCLFFLCSVIGCTEKTRQVVPNEYDSEEVYKPLKPNEEDAPEGLTFGPKNTPGYVFDCDMTTESHDVYVLYSNFTVLDINPAITESLFSFMQEQLCEYDFVKDSTALEPGQYSQFLDEGLNYKDAAAKLIGIQKKEFEARIESDKALIYPFNISFQVYPIYLDDKYITYLESAYTYTGGAHGITSTYLHTFDLESGKLLTLQDIVKPERESEVRGEVAAHMAYSYPIYENIKTVEQYIDSLNVWVGTFNGSDTGEPDNRITVSNFPMPDVALTNEGLAVVYQMYDYTPGSDGCPLVVIPYKDIKGCLKL